MLGLPQESPGGCPCPKQEQEANGVKATPATDSPVHSEAPAQPQPVMVPATGGQPQGMVAQQPIPGYGQVNQQQQQRGPLNPAPYLQPQLEQSMGQAPQPQQPQPPQGAVQVPEAPPYPCNMPAPEAPKLEEMQVVVLGDPNEFLAQWLSTKGLLWRRAHDSYDVDVTRNRVTREFLAHDVPRGKQYLIMLDADMVPCGETENLLTAVGDLVYCGHVGAQGGRGHSGPGNFAAACFRVSLRCLQQIGNVTRGVWWNMGKDPTRSERTHCECSYFNSAARQAGFAPVQVGVIGHMQTCIIFPVNNSPERWSLMWPVQYRHMIPQGVAASGGP